MALRCAASMAARRFRPLADGPVCAQWQQRWMSSAYSRENIQGCDDAGLRALLEDDKFLSAVSVDDDLRGGFQDRVTAASGDGLLEVSRLGEAEPGEGGQEVHTYAAHLFGTDDTPFILGTMRVALWKADTSAMIFRTASRSPAVPASAMSQIASTAANEMHELHGADKVAAVARLDGLCAWVAGSKAWEALDEPGRGAVQAIALGRPREGHSVLGAGTYRDAREDWTTLALGFADRAETGECAVFRGSGGFKLAGVNWLHDTSPGALADSGGATAAFHFDVGEEA